MTDSTIILGSAKQLPTDDVDYGHVTSVISRNVDDAINEDSVGEVKPATQTTSFYTMVGAAIAGILAIVLTNKGLIGSNQTSMVSELMTPSIVVGIAWIAGKFVEARGKVSVAKVQLQQQQLALKYAQN